MSERVQSYFHLLDMSYDGAIDSLLEKYGPAKDDYYREASYNRFIKKEIKNISKGKYQRTSEGLYCHHIDENKWANLAEPYFIEVQKIPYTSQKKEKLVYCDLVEHLILHAIIIKETKGLYGHGGYNAFLKPMVEDWFIKKQLPSREWMLNCYNLAFLTSSEAQKLLITVENYLDNVPSYLKRKLEIEKIIKEREAKEKRIEEEKLKRIEEKNAKFTQKYPEFKNLGISRTISRQKILDILYDLKYNNHFSSNAEFKTFKLSAFRDELLDELYREMKK